MATMIIASGIAGCSAATSTGAADGTLSGASQPTVQAQPSASASLGSASAHPSGPVATKAAQERLAEVGCYSGTIDGMPGPQTSQAVTAFQKASGLPVDGQLGPQTLAAVEKAATSGEQVCSAPTPSASSSDTAKPSAPTPVSNAMCNDEAIVAALKRKQNVIDYTCADDAGGVHWAGGQQSTGADIGNFFLKANGSTWVVVPNDEACSDEVSLSLPEALLKYCGVGPVAAD